MIRGNESQGFARSGRVQEAPIKVVQSWLEGLEASPANPLIDVSQAAPALPPPLALREAMAEYLLTTDEAHLYGPILGNTTLRQSLARSWSASYDSDVTLDQIAITSGCNQAFCAAISTLAEDGDEIILVTPWYFNHNMWLEMSGVHVVALHCDETLLPSVETAAALITDKTKAICMVSPNNPCGIEYPDPLLHSFFELAKDAGIHLILDETYKDFHSNPHKPHSLLSKPHWDRTLIQLYSFSKTFRLTGHRVGAVVTSPERIKQIEKFLDTVTICPSQVGQFAADWGLNNLSAWVKDQRNEIATRRQYVEQNAERLGKMGWSLRGCGAYFAYFDHPFDFPSLEVARALVQEAHILCLPEDMFVPTPKPSPESGLYTTGLRFAFANVTQEVLENMIQRLEDVRL